MKPLPELVVLLEAMRGVADGLTQVRDLEVSTQAQRVVDALDAFNAAPSWGRFDEASVAMADLLELTIDLLEQAQLVPRVSGNA